MDDLTIGRTATSHDAMTPERLAALVSARLCHDLISPLGAIGNGLELLQMSPGLRGIADSPEFLLMAESVAASRARIRWFRTAFGHAAADQRMSVAEIAAMLAEGDQGGRLRLRIDAQGDLPRSEAQLILLALMCLETALPWGGSVLICRGAQGWRLLAEAARTKPDPALWSWLDGAEVGSRPDPAPGEVHFVLLSRFAASAARQITWELDDKGGEISF